MIPTAPTVRRLLSLVLLPSALLGCSGRYKTLYREGIAENQHSLQKLELGMTSEQVKSIMGDGTVVQHKKISLVDPWRSESFLLQDGTKVLVLYYVTQPPRKYYNAQDHELTPVVLENDRVAGWGWSFLSTNHDRYRVSPRAQR